MKFPKITRREFIQVGAAMGAAVSTAVAESSSQRRIPYPAALDDAAIRVERLDNIYEYSLILGNGDMNGLLFSRGRDLVLSVTKGDVWDARMDTSNDPPLLPMKRILELSKRAEWPSGGKFEGGFLNPDGRPYTGPNHWGDPLPCPRMAAEIRFDAASLWEHGATDRLATLTSRVGEPPTGSDFSGERGR